MPGDVVSVSGGEFWITFPSNFSKGLYSPGCRSVPSSVYFTGTVIYAGTTSPHFDSQFTSPRHCVAVYVSTVNASVQAELHESWFGFLNRIILVTPHTFGSAMIGRLF